MITESEMLLKTKIANDSLLCARVGMKNAGRCQTAQIAPSRMAAASGDRKRSNAGSANPRQPNSSPSGPESVTSVKGSK